MDLKFISVGYNNLVSANRVISIVSPDSAPVKRMIHESQDRGIAIDATCGRRTRAVIITDTGQVVLSAIQPETLQARLGVKEEASNG